MKCARYSSREPRRSEAAGIAIRCYQQNIFDGKSIADDDSKLHTPDPGPADLLIENFHVVILNLEIIISEGVVFFLYLFAISIHPDVGGLHILDGFGVKGQHRYFLCIRWLFLISGFKFFVLGLCHGTMI